MGVIIAAVWVLEILHKGYVNDEESSGLNTLGSYWTYCRPLLIYVLISFVYEFTDKWMLQKFAGAHEQGYYQLAYQVAAIALIATSSILRIFWKEIAEANLYQDKDKIYKLYFKMSRGLVMLGAILSGFIIPWTKQILGVLMGSAYSMAWPVVAIMFLYPIHQALGQINGTMLLACERTKTYMLSGSLIMLLSIAISYLMQAPRTYIIPGLALGAIGVALKMVIMNIVGVNIQSWLIARYSQWKFDWGYQVVGIILMIGAGYLAKWLTTLIWNIEQLNFTFRALFFPLTVCGILYLIFAMVLVLFLPWLVGSNKEEVSSLWSKTKLIKCS
jgi:O-antigen/teichoic acid export membrane protein